MQKKTLYHRIHSDNHAFYCFYCHGASIFFCYVIVNKHCHSIWPITLWLMVKNDTWGVNMHVIPVFVAINHLSRVVSFIRNYCWPVLDMRRLGQCNLDEVDQVKIIRWLWVSVPLLLSITVTAILLSILFHMYLMTNKIMGNFV